MPGRPAINVRSVLSSAAVIFCAVWSLTSLWLPFGWDQGIFASVGDVILAGGMPYRDAWDIKGPLAHLWFAAAQFVFGRGQAGIRVFDLALLIWAAVVLARAGGGLARPSAAVWTAVGLVLCHASLTFFFTAQPDGAVSLLLVLAFTPLLLASRPRHTVIAGLVVGLCALVKPIYVVFLILPLWVAAGAAGEPARRIKRGALVVAASALPVVATLAWFVSRGALSDLIDVLFRYNAQDYSGVNQLAVRTRISGYVEYFWSGPRAPALPFIVFGAVVAWRRSRSSGGLIIGWLLGALAIVGMQGKFYRYHWTVIFPPAILLIGIAVDALMGPPTEPARRPTSATVLGWTAAAVILAPLTIQPARDIGHWVRFATGIDTSSQYYARFRLGEFSAADQMAAATFIRTRTAATDRVATFGYEATLIYLSGRPNATRFSYALPLVGWRSSQASRDAYRREFMDALRVQPAYVVVGPILVGGTQSIEVFPEFAEYLARGYVLERSFGAVDLYHRVR